MAEKTSDKTYPSQFEKVKEITDKLEAGIKALFESEHYMSIRQNNQTQLIEQESTQMLLIQNISICCGRDYSLT